MTVAILRYRLSGLTLQLVKGKHEMLRLHPSLGLP